MNILFLRGFNNYFNRIVKKYSTLGDYKDQSESYLDLSNINFNPNDGVATELIVGSTNQKENNAPLAWDTIGTPDYAICYEMEGNPAAAVIKFRWFVLESERTRNGQYRIALKRDLIAEHYSQIMNAPCFVEKGYVNNKNNSLLYNNESMTYNQIKSNEITLKDNTKTGWIVGYLAKNRANTPHNVSTSIAILDGIPVDYYDEEDLPFNVSTSSNTTVYNYINNTFTTAVPATHIQSGGWGSYHIQQGWKLNNINNSDIQTSTASNRSPSFIDTGYTISTSVSSSEQVYNVLANNGYNRFKITSAVTVYNSSGNPAFTITPAAAPYNGNTNFLDKYCYWAEWGSASENYSSAIQKNGAIYNAITPTVSTTFKNVINSIMGETNSVSDTNLRSIYNDKYVKVGNDYYRISIEDTGRKRYEIITYNEGAEDQGRWFPTFSAQNQNEISIFSTFMTSYASDFSQGLNSIMSSQSGADIQLVDSQYVNSIFIIATSTIYNVVLTKVSVETVSTTLNTGRRITYDCIADIFAIPYGDLKYKITSDGTVYTTNRDEGLAIARAIAMELGDTVCYDLQLLPYVPSEIVRNLMQDSDTLCLADLESANYDTVQRTFTGVTSEATFILYVSSCKGTFDIPVTLTPKTFGYGDIINYKLSNETEICRLVSPNFNSMFEFSLAKNGGITKINVDYTYKPYTPYIHMNPDFKNLYGQDWDDSRGLILSGDFSLASVSSAWTTYQNNNKNYQAIFNRQIENMDVNNQIAKEQLNWQTIAGYFGGGISGGIGGALAGAKMGGGYGAIAGAVGGAYMGTVGAVIGGEMDKDWLNRQQTEAKNYAIDMYGYQLGNIKAMPYALSRSESLTNNHKIFPIIELYECTDTEISNLYNKLQYNGMTIMAIGKLIDFSVTSEFPLGYLQGQLIRLDGLNDDFHIADAIYQEVKKGFYILQGGN